VRVFTKILKAVGQMMMKPSEEQILYE